MERVRRRLWRWGLWNDPVEPGGREPHAEVRLMQFNVCGSACNEGDTGALVDGLRDLVLELSPDVVLLNEICLAQAGRLWERLQDFAVSAAFAATAGVSRCPGVPGRRWYGNAVFSKREGIGAPEVTALSNRLRAVERRSVLTMRTPLAGLVALVSATHLMPKSRELNDRQLAELLAIQSGRAASGDVVVFGGDFNATPAELTKAEGKNVPQFVEIDRAQAPTFGTRKIDYILLDRRYFRRLDATAQASPLSDHRYLFGTARLR